MAKKKAKPAVAIKREGADDAPTQQETVAGYSGSQHEGQKPPARPKGASADAAVSPVGHSEPSIEIREKQT